MGQTHDTVDILLDSQVFTGGQAQLTLCWRLLLSMTSIMFYGFVILEKNIFAELLNIFFFFFLSHTFLNELYFCFHSFISSFCSLILNSLLFILSFRKVFCLCWYFSGFYLTFFSWFSSWIFFYWYPFIFYSFSFSFFFSFFLGWVLNIFLLFINFIL